MDDDKFEQAESEYNRHYDPYDYEEDENEHDTD